MISMGVGLHVYPKRARINPQNSWLLGASSQISQTAVFCSRVEAWDAELKTERKGALARKAGESKPSQARYSAPMTSGFARSAAARYRNLSAHKGREMAER